MSPQQRRQQSLCPKGTADGGSQFGVGEEVLLGGVSATHRAAASVAARCLIHW